MSTVTNSQSLPYVSHIISLPARKSLTKTCALKRQLHVYAAIETLAPVWQKISNHQVAFNKLIQ